MICGFHQCCVFFFKQKTAYEMRISDWSSDVCSSDLTPASTKSTSTCAWPTWKRCTISTRPCSNACCRRSGAGSPPTATARPWTKKAGHLAGPALVDAHASDAGLRLAVPAPPTALALFVALVVVRLEARCVGEDVV